MIQGGTGGFIYALIVGVWAVVLVPMWVRRHSEAAAERSADSFSRAMRVLARRAPVADDVTEAAERADCGTLLHRDAQPYAGGKARPSARVRVRRARLLFGLLLTTLAATVLAVFSVVPTLLALISVVLLGGYVALLRTLVKEERRAAARESGWRLASSVTSSRIADGGAVAPSAVVPPAAVIRRTELFDAQAPDIVIDLRDENWPEVSGEHWDARDLPLPTYVQKNAMHRRHITLSGEGHWTTQAPPAPKPAEEETAAAADAEAARNDPGEAVGQ